MNTYMNSLQQISTIIQNERKMGGAVEAEVIRLRTGEQFISPVITSIDTDGSAIYAMGIFTNDGKRLIVNVNEVATITNPMYKRLCGLNNTMYKTFKTGEKIKYLRRLCELNEGSNNPIFREEVVRIAEDIGEESFMQLNLNLSFMKPVRKVVPMQIA